MTNRLDGLTADDWMPGDRLRVVLERQGGADYYAAYTRFIREREVTSVVEIGVRCGYSMAAMLRGNPWLAYLGIDNASENHGGIVGGLAHAEILRQRYAKGEAMFLEADSHTVSCLPRRFDLAHIDGDHSTAGCLQDLELCARWCDLLLVDDVNAIETVATAVKMFCEASRLNPEIIHTYTGWALIDLRGTS